MQHQDIENAAISNKVSSWASRLLYVLGLFSIVAFIAVAYRLGKEQAETDWQNAVTGRDQLEQAHAEALGEITRLKSSLEFERARSDRELQINQQAFEDISETLLTTSHEIADLKEDLRFYESVIQTEGQGQGLQIRALSISATESPDRYGYSLIIVNGSYGKKKKKGSVKIELHGINKGNAEMISVKNEKGKNSIPLFFKYFQKLDGILELPDHFQPRRIKVSVKMRGAKSDNVDKWYDWPLLQAGQEQEARQKTGGVEQD
jgi:hypothetical protein